MKICLAFLSFGKDVFAGIENSIYNLSLGLQVHHVEVVVYSSYLSGAESQIDTIPVFRSALLPSSLPAGDATLHSALKRKAPELQEEFAAFIQKEHIDVVISFDALWGILQVAGISASPPCPCVLSFHVLNTQELLREAARMPYLFRRTVSPILKQQIEQVMPLENMFVIPNSLDCRQFVPAENAGFSSKVIFCNARIDVGKGIPDLITAFAEFRQKHPGYELWLCGGDFPFGNKTQAAQEVAHLIDQYKIAASVKLLPSLRWSEIPTVIRQAFVVVLPTYYESFGRAALEALACGVPLIATRAGNIPHLVKDAASLVETGSAAAIYEALCLLAESPEKYHALATRGPQVAAPYDNGVVAQQFIQVLSDCLPAK